MDKRSRKAKSKATERQEEPVDGATHDVARSVSPKRGANPTPDWLLTFLAHQEERGAKREESHEATMHMLCEAFSRRSRHTSPAEIVNEQSTEITLLAAKQHLSLSAHLVVHAPRPEHQNKCQLTLLYEICPLGDDRGTILRS